MRARSCSIAELLSAQNRFMLPYFQRGYAWQVEHVLRLVTDVLEVAEGRRKLPWYPLGSIIVAREDGATDGGLTDGHQRMVTLTMLLAILRDLEQDPALKQALADCIFRINGQGAREPRLQTQEGLRVCLTDYVQADGAIDRPDPVAGAPMTDSQNNLIANRRALLKLIRPLPDERRRRFAEFLLHKCVIVVMEVESEEIARLLFSTMHDTGIRPTDVDLFKSEVLGTIDEDSRDAAQSVWELTETSLGQNHMEGLLRHITTIAERKRPKGDIETRLATLFKLKTPDGALAFVERRIGAVGAHLIDAIAAQVDRNDRPSALRRRLRFLGWVRNHDTWMAPLLHWLDLYGADEGATLDFLDRLEALAWCQMVVASDPEQRDRRYMQLLAEISEGRAMKEGSALSVTAGERREMREILGGANFTKRKYKQFLLLRIDAAMRGADDPLPLPNGTIEHIYPARPAESSRWRIDFKGSEAPVLRQTIGNVTLLTIAEQDKAKNKDYGQKRPVYADSGFLITRELAKADEWTPAAVRARSIVLVDRAMQAWGLA